MISSNRIELLHQLTTDLDSFQPTDWYDLVYLLENAKNRRKALGIPHGEDGLNLFARGTAFITFSYGIDGVTIEISKYAHTISDLYKPLGNPSIYIIGGNFQPQVTSIFDAEWRQYKLDGIDGWSKWGEGKWFDALFRAKMSSLNTKSNLLTNEIYQQAVVIAKRLGQYFIENNINLVIPVNVASNPGNIALTLGLVLVVEYLGIFVLNINHDFYWESGKPLTERTPGEKPGIRDHFFRNIKNKTFFYLFRLLYPWNGDRWLQININARQSRKLVTKYGFPEQKVFEISTCVNDTFFKPYSTKDVVDIRLRMGHILSNGEPIIRPVPIIDHLSRVEAWMKNQEPIFLGARQGLSVDPRSDDLLIMLQPTRIVARKRIERNLDLIDALFRKSVLREEFQNNLNRQLVLHITGPTPQEHQEDLEKILCAYKEIISALPEMLANRIFLAFSVGHESHASFPKNKFQPLTIETIYRMADVVVFPSETEGRGLPIIEASASGIPIICSHYHPKDVFSDVIGEKLPKELRIKYTLFPEGRFHQKFLSDVANLLIHPGDDQNQITHNKEAVRARYSQTAFTRKFRCLLNQFHELDKV